MAKDASAKAVKSKSSLAHKLVGQSTAKAVEKDVKEKVLQMALLANAAKKKSKTGKSPNQKKIDAFVKSEGKKSEKEAKKARAVQAIEDMRRVQQMQQELDAAVAEEKSASKKRKVEKQNQKNELKQTKREEKDCKSKDCKGKVAKGKNDNTINSHEQKGAEATEFRNEKVKKRLDFNGEKTGLDGEKKRGAEAPSVSAPGKRHRMKSPALSVVTDATDASSAQYTMKRENAEKAMQKELESAFVVAAAKAENDGTDIEKFLEELDVDLASVASEAKRRVAEEMDDKEGGSEEEEEDDEQQEEEDEEEEDEDQESCEGSEEDGSAGEGEESSDGEMPALEAPEEVEEEKQEQDAASEEVQGSDEEEQESEQDEEDGDEAEGQEESKQKDETQNKTKKDEKQEKDNQDALQKAVTETVRNSKSHKKEWDKFDREIKGKKMPESLRPLLRRKKTDIFALWLDHQQDWDKVEVQVTRLSSTTNTSRKQWQAIQVKTLKEQMSQERLDDLLRKRAEQGLTYKDDDYPNDPLEEWVFMPSGRLLRTDDTTAEELKTTGSKTGGRNLLDAMTSEDGGPLSAGACPTVKGISENGQKLIWKALDEEGKEVAKTAKVPKNKGENNTESLEPKTIMELGAQVNVWEAS